MNVKRTQITHEITLSPEMQLSGQFAADNRAEHKTHARSRRRRASHNQQNTHEKRADAAEARADGGHCR